MAPFRTSYSAITDWQRCPRYYGYKHVERIDRIGSKGRSLGFGSAFHLAQAKLWSWEGDHADPARLQGAAQEFARAALEEGLSYEDRVLGEILLIGYTARWDDLRLSFHTPPIVEQKVIAPILAPNGEPDEELEVAAVFDVVAYDEEGRTIPVEHKTTVSDISPGSAYWNRLELNLQASLYYIVASDVGRYVGHVLWDAIRAPELKRLQATPPEKREFYVRKTERKDGTVAMPGDPKPGIRLNDETANQFAQRVMGEVLSNPLGFYGRLPLHRDESELDRVRYDLWSASRQMLHAKETGLFPRNLDACFKFNRPCQYLPVCRGEASIEDPALYRVRESREPEAEKVLW